MKSEAGLLDYFIVLLKWRKWLAINFLAVAITTGVIVFLIPKWYLATATILPPRKELGLFGLPSALNNLPLGGLDLLKGSDEVMIYMAILQSRTVWEAVIHKFDLIKVYEKEDIEKALKELSNNVEINQSKEGTISVGVLDQSPQRAADMANAFIHFLDSVNVVLNVQKARNNRIFIGRRLDDNKAEMSQAEEALRSFQEKYGAISLPVQTEAAIKGAAELLAQITATEVELGVLERSLTPTHGEMIQKRSMLVELRRKLDEIRYGDISSLPGTNGKNRLDADAIFIPFKHVPQIGLQYVRLYREVEVQKILYQLLVQQYEQARLQEARDTPTVQVLDRATPPLRKAKPKRLAIILLSAISATLIFVVFIFAGERLRLLRQEDPESYEKLARGLDVFGKKARHE